ncbi:pentapeptide repeat-containing protein [Flavobacterium sp. NG2]|uniref:pentapeptide repeat-containing protein n=1 Tax=Flavobacterium sp. NG2 TaxID=3097547 RepID=UPI002A80CCC8|nr:pentapeptide repeat-containing protein [Flavobacterium sp. NG2]WPR70397.1 pentapeptide repeat-containing protein [Flavobacterium sp. NG2]
MPEYFLDQNYNTIFYQEEELNFKEFEACIFTNCDFTQCNFKAITFIDCTFTNCNFNNANINHVAFRTVYFNQCQIIDVNFAMTDKFIFEIHFKDCILDFSKFYALKMKGTTFTNCSLIAVDFMQTDLTAVSFTNCDLYRAEFDKATANKVDFSTSRNYTINPKTTKLKKAVFSLEYLKGLLFKHDVIVE